MQCAASSCSSNLDNKSHFHNSIADSLHIWRQELSHDLDHKFLLAGIEHGFTIVDNVDNVVPVEVGNHKSTSDPEAHQAVENQLKAGIAEGHYCIPTQRPTIISALGAIPKQSSVYDINKATFVKSMDCRVIHDCSLPKGQSVNDYCNELESVQYETVQNAIELAGPGYYMAKVDLKNAYKSVPIHPSNYHLTGFKWHFTGHPGHTYLCDTRLPFGAKRAPGIFHRLTQSIKRMLLRRGYDRVVVYLDDFLVIAPTKHECTSVLNILLHLLRRLGFCISWPKVAGPAQRITFLGFDIDTVSQSLELPRTKLSEFCDLLKWFCSAKRVSLKQLQRLAGKLNWACHVVRGGRVFLRRILDCMSLLKQPHHRMRITPEILADVHWWLNYIATFNCKRLWDTNPKYVHLYMDACNSGAGVQCGSDWVYVNWDVDWPLVKGMHINHKEVLALFLAAHRWAPDWKNTTVVVHTDSTCALGIIRKGSTRNHIIMECMRSFFWLSELHQFQVWPVHIPGKDNHIPDAISRIGQPGQLARLASLLYPGDHHGLGHLYRSLAQHMSYNSFVSFFPQVVAAPNWKRS